jgi:hypothetical protein
LCDLASISPSQLDAAAKRLLAEVLDSFEKLDLVVQLHRRRPQRCTVDELAQAVTLARDLVAETLVGLAADGVVRTAEHDGRWALVPDGKWAPSIDALVQAYDEDRIVVLDAMTRLALDRIRGQAARVFSDAFLIRRPKKGKPDG